MVFAELYVFLTSMLPIIELRGAIPLGVALGLPIFRVSVISILGNLIIVPILLLGIEWFFGHIKRLMIFRSFIENYESRAADKIIRYREFRMLGLFLLVAIPFPGTGVYTGCLAARIMKMNLKNAWIATSMGVVISGVLVGFITSGIISFGY